MSSRITQLAQSVLANTTKLDQHQQNNNHPSPSFDATGPRDFGITDADVEKSRLDAIESATELIDLLQGPVAPLRPFYNGASLQAISRWSIASKVPRDGDISYTELAKQCGGISELDVRRILRYAMVYHRLFCEPRKGFVAHSLASLQLSEEPHLAGLLWLMGDSSYASYPHIVPALENFKDQEPHHAPWSLAFHSSKSMYDAMQDQPILASNFANAMASFASFPDSTIHQASHALPGMEILHYYPWSNLSGSQSAIHIVDIGGSTGDKTLPLVEALPNLSLTVQDLPQTIVGAEQSIPEHLRPRVNFMAYDFFTPQTRIADAYILKHCLHNWPDHYCVRILRNQIPVLRPGARIIIIDHILPEPGTMGLLVEKKIRALDMLMLTNHNARERELEDFKTLIKQADSRFQIGHIHQSQPSSADFPTGAIEVIWPGN
ncbi:hypothetical protein ASPWEDRAFT_172332 [Aspergillus wentii DTO 134E9]|uniref:O-methyltransferase C-terminal domain-containing protein n=1 Tax=Aspergillus wentii DTO 134E9 TaxID=1073089 RepID=A0A1L9RKS8_ASPWE|nr:uncharacterized protein ASPWEDRAFT_172332 [Aspergillus wentii DTO 134E9]KAI9924704.1 hypothetical protein MW887_006556 [Aspergillus wentii]OJJ35530.1 hypothetical protein ASPWEDRAFT_172332 [Aspergillus wentii DTO 134E9]